MGEDDVYLRSQLVIAALKSGAYNLPVSRGGSRISVTNLKEDVERLEQFVKEVR